MRPAARAALSRWRGVIAAAVVCGGALALLGPAAWRGSILAALALVALLQLSIWLARDGLLRARLLSRDGPGVAQVREGRIVYFGPESGGVADLDALDSIWLVVGVWELRTQDGDALRVPVAARGAERLPDAFAALPGFDAGRVASALAASAAAHALVWRRGGGRAPTLLDALRRPA